MKIVQLASAKEVRKTSAHVRTVNKLRSFFIAESVCQRSTFTKSKLSGFHCSSSRATTAKYFISNSICTPTNYFIKLILHLMSYFNFSLWNRDTTRKLLTGLRVRIAIEGKEIFQFDDLKSEFVSTTMVQSASKAQNKHLTNASSVAIAQFPLDRLCWLMVNQLKHIAFMSGHMSALEGKCAFFLMCLRHLAP